MDMVPQTGGSGQAAAASLLTADQLVWVESFIGGFIFLSEEAGRSAGAQPFRDIIADAHASRALLRQCAAALHAALDVLSDDYAWKACDALDALAAAGITPGTPDGGEGAAATACAHSWAITVSPMATLPDKRRLWGTPDGNVRIDGDGGVFCRYCGLPADVASGAQGQEASRADGGDVLLAVLTGAAGVAVAFMVAGL